MNLDSILKQYAKLMDQRAKLLIRNRDTTKIDDAQESLYKKALKSKLISKTDDLGTLAFKKGFLK
jgi:hypothetical protein